MSSTVRLSVSSVAAAAGTLALGLALILRHRTRARKQKPSVGFIFDLDGTLLDFEGASHDALNAPLLRFGKHVDWRLHASICGKPAHAWSKEILEALNVTEISPEQYAEEWHDYILRAFPTMRLLPGALSIVERAQNRYGHSVVAIATSSERKNFDAKMSFHPHLVAHIDQVVTGDEIPRGKPNPDIFIEAARRIGVPPSRCIVFEDSPAGALGGKRAGCLVVAIPDDRMVGIESAFQVADVVVRSLEEIDDTALDGLVARVTVE